MPKGAALSQGSSGEIISHFTGVRMRVVGSGSLQLRMLSLDETQTTTLVPLTMAATTNREPLRLANFIQQRAMLEGKTTEIDETFRINRIIVYSKPLWSEFPG